MSEWGYKPEIIKVNVDETLPPRSDLYAGVKTLAERKALAGFKLWQEAGGNKGDVVIGADTMVVLGGQALGKPVSREDAEKMLESLSAREHIVLTGLALVRRAAAASTDAAGTTETPSSAAWEIASDAAETQVRFRRLLPAEIKAYVESGEPLDKAGAYGIQGEARKFVESYQGSLSNVIGLPMELLTEMLKAWGIEHRV